MMNHEITVMSINDFCEDLYNDTFATLDRQDVNLSECAVDGERAAYIATRISDLARELLMPPTLAPRATKRKPESMTASERQLRQNIRNAWFCETIAAITKQRDYLESINSSAFELSCYDELIAEAE